LKTSADMNYTVSCLLQATVSSTLTQPSRLAVKTVRSRGPTSAKWLVSHKPFQQALWRCC